MNLHPRTARLVLAIVTTGVIGGWVDRVRSETLDVLPSHKELPVARDMMAKYLLGQIEEAKTKWLADYETRKTPEQIDAYQKRLKSEFIARISHELRTPLNAAHAA